MLTKLVQNALVRIRASVNRNNAPTAVATITGEDEDGRAVSEEHRFDANSRVSKNLEVMSPVQLSERLSGGAYFFVNGHLFDFRDGNYNGFIHTPDNIDAMKNTIGIREMERGYNRTDQGRVSLSREWSKNEIIVPNFGKGGKFDSRLTFSWNPFVRTIRSSFDIIRLICENGMTGLTSLFSAKVPLENRWEEHLDIASVQIQNKLNSMTSQRFEQMGVERATIADCLLLQNHAENRMVREGHFRPKEEDRLRNIAAAVAPDLQLSDHYKPSVFDDKRLSAQLPSHLSAFDAYNIATELASHTSEGAGSSNHGLAKFANGIVFDRADRRHHAARFGAGPEQAAFSDPDAAFFGTVKA